MRYLLLNLKAFLGNLTRKAKRRRIYEENLIRKGLELEHIKGKVCLSFLFQ